MRKNSNRSIRTGNPIQAPLISPRERLLAAAEFILLEKGFSALSTRAISNRAETNVSQIRYYFEGLEGLLEALLAEELKCVTNAFASDAPLDEEADLDRLVEILLTAVSAPACYTVDGYAALVIEEVYHHVSDGMRAKTAAALNKAHAPFLAALARQTKSSDRGALRIRFIAMIAMVMSLSPRGAGRRLLVAGGDKRSNSEDVLRDELKRICCSVFTRS